MNIQTTLEKQRKAIEKQMKEDAKNVEKQRKATEKQMKEDAKNVEKQRKATEKQMKEDAKNVEKQRKATEKQMKEDAKNVENQRKIDENNIKQILMKRISTRASVEYNGMELVLPILILNKDIDNYDKLSEIINDISVHPNNYPNIIFNDFNVDFKNYEKDIRNKKQIVNDYITYFRNISSHERLQNIKCIYICGKKNKHQKIDELNKGLDKKDTKADIYIEYLDGIIAGISVKQSVDATKSNYSVQKMLGNNELDKTLTEVKKKYLNENGFVSFKKIERDKINRLFYPQNKENAYWIRIREEIKNNNQKIVEKLIELLYSLNVKYEMYEFDGHQLKKLNENVDVSSAKFEEYPPYYLTKCGKERETAKLFYRLSVGEHKYRVEIRWKGNIYDASPQFQIHMDD